jgi:hypothetical protein
MTFDAQTTTLTQDYIVPMVFDQTLDSNVSSMIFMADGKPWAGESYKFPVKLSNHTQGGAFSEYEEFSTNNQNVRQMASFDPRGYYQSVVLGGIQKSVNGIARTKVMDLVKVEMESVSQDMMDDVGAILQGTGADGKSFLGVNAGADDGNEVATYGGLSRTTYPNWVSSLSTSVGAWDFSKARTLWNRATLGNQKPDLAYGDETTFGYIEADYLAVVDGQYNVIEANRARLTRGGVKPAMRDALVGQSGMDVLYYAGTPIARDSKAPAQELDVLNTKFWDWIGLTPADTNAVSFDTLYHDANDSEKVPTSYGFGWTGFTRPTNQYAFIGQFILLGNLINKAPRLSTRGETISS